MITISRFMQKGLFMTKPNIYKYWFLQSKELKLQILNHYKFLNRPSARPLIAPRYLFG